MFGAIFQIPVVEAQGTITIREDGIIVPGGLPIIKSDPTTFVFTDNIEGGYELVVENDAIVIDGAGYSLIGLGTGTGVFIQGRQHITLRNLVVKNFEVGIILENSGLCTIQDNTFENNRLEGIVLSINSRSNLLSRNIIRENGDDGIEIRESSDQNTINSNLIVENDDNGIDIENSSLNVITANAFINNDPQVGSYFGGENIWDRGYPDGGNFWSDHNNFRDSHQGPEQDRLGSDGIVDSPYVIHLEENINDNYPLADSQFKISTRINIDLSHTIMIKGNKLLVSGSISPIISGANISLIFDPPVETARPSVFRHALTQLDGSFQREIEISTVGDWKVNAFWGGSDTYSSSESIQKTFNVKEPGGEGNWIEDLFGSQSIPGFPWESILMGVLIGLGTIFFLKKKRLPLSST